MSVPGVAAFHQGGSAPGSGSGDVTGPGSSTDNAVVRFDGAGGKTLQNSTVTIDDTGNVTFPARILGKQGANIASATDIVMGSGNYFVITGTTTIESILSTGWTAGSMVFWRFTASVTVNHIGAGGSFDPIHLQSAANLACGAGDTLGLLYDGSDWWQISFSNN